MTGVIPGRKAIHSELTSMLCVHLANMYSLSLRLQNFHWNVKGPQFYSAHTLFEEYYRQTSREVDIIAERIRTLGEYAPGSLGEFYKLSRLTDRRQPLDSDGMFGDLITCCVVVREYCTETLKTAGALADEATSDMLIQNIKLLEKAIWMFRSSITRTEKIEDDVLRSTERRSKAMSPNRESHQQPAASPLM